MNRRKNFRRRFWITPKECKIEGERQRKLGAMDERAALAHRESILDQREVELWEKSMNLTKIEAYPIDQRNEVQINVSVSRLVVSTMQDTEGLLERVCKHIYDRLRRAL